MKLKFPIILSLLILLPMIVLAWMGNELLSNNRVVQEHQQQQLVNSQLRAADQKILSYFTELESALLEQPAFNPNDTDLIRTYIQESPYIENVFVLSAQGRLLFPNQQLASNKELEFIEKTAELWSSMQAFKPDIPTDIGSIEQKRKRTELDNDSSFSVSGALGKLRTRRSKAESASLEELTDTEISSPAPASIASKAAGSDNVADFAVAPVRETELSKQATAAQAKVTLNTGHGWTVWRTGTKSQIFFWFWNEKNQLTGLKLIPSFWLSELISRLPGDNSATEIIGNARIQLLNEAQDVQHQWGSFEHSQIENIQPLGQRILSHPLDGWRLAYFSPQKTTSNLQWLFYLGILLFFGLLIFGLGLYIWREYRRDMRIAEQRVTFVNQVSHELKTPLTNICLYAELLESENEDLDANVKISKYTQVLTTESQRLGRLINNVLSFSRSEQTEQNKQRIEKKNGNINDVIANTIEIFKPAFSAKNIQIDIDLQANKQALFDANAVEQILNNLLGNIEKYAAKGQYALIRSRSDKDMTEIHVLDHGPGISKSASKKIFEPFFRGSEKLTEGVSGTGIGLSIARDLCRKHGGDLLLQSNKPEHANGAHFVATLNVTTENQVN